ncbi:MAG: UDP-3-O-(3-hydroxymyristoyl)glucosamine N-acyltransferase [Verrucomicrobiota bacterium]
MTLTTAEIAKKLAGEVIGDASAVLTGFAHADAAKPGDLTFAETEEFLTSAENSAATAIIAGKNAASTKKTIIRVANPRIAFAKALAIFFPEPEFAAGIHPTAVVASSAQIHPTAHVGPHCVVGEHVELGAGVVLQAGNAIGADSVLGSATHLFPNVTIYPRTQIGQRVRIHAGAVIGADGFGYVLDAGVHLKVPQVGKVIIGDDVEIGANSTVDRGALGATVIGKGTKIDNLVQIGHNVQIGENCILIAQAGIAGSSKLGNYVIIAGQAGVAGHLNIGHQAIVGGQAGVMNDIPDKGKWLGSPAQPDKDFKRQVIALRLLPDLLKKVSSWEKKLSGE